MLIRRRRGTWAPPAVEAFAREGLLQEMLSESPDLLGLGEPVAVVRELRVPKVGEVDLAAVSTYGRIVLIECKRADNPEIRRSVVGQVFAYAAGLWGLGYEEFDSLFKAREGRSLATAVAAAAEAAGIEDEWDEDIFRQSVADNLEKGQFDLVIAVDRITAELKLVVPYLNEQTRSEIRVLALELDYRADGDVEILVPKIYGEESAARKAQRSTREVWDEEFFFRTLAQECPEGARVIRRLYDQAAENDNDFRPGGSAAPSLTAVLSVGSVRAQVWRCNTRPPARLVFLFNRMQGEGVSPERMERFLVRLRDIPGVADQFDGVKEAGWRRKPSIPVSLLAAPGVGDEVVLAIEELLGTELT